MATVNPIKELQPVIMTERGTITKIYGRAFVAGVLPFKVKHLLHVHTFTRTGSHVSNWLQLPFGNNCNIIQDIVHFKLVREDDHNTLQILFNHMYKVRDMLRLINPGVCVCVFS